MTGELTDQEKAYYALTRKVWALLAPFYDFFASPFLYGVRDRVVTFTHAPEGSRVLDVATGTGEQAFAFAKKEYDVIGIDLSEAMLRVARRKNTFGNARFELADATDLPFGDSWFDVSSVSFALHEVPSTIGEKILREMARVTRSNGIVEIVDFHVPENRIGRFLVNHVFSLWEPGYYRDFIRSDIRAILARNHIDHVEKSTVLKGTVAFYKGRNNKQP